MKKGIAACLVLFCIALAWPTVVSANAPAPPSYFYCSVENAPADARYMDLLIEITSRHGGYTAFNQNNGQRNGIDAASEIAQYNRDGYMSLSCHYAHVNADMDVDSPYFTMDYADDSLDAITKTVKVALLDKDGNILLVSEAAVTSPPDSEHFARSLSYNADAAAPVIVFNAFYKGRAPLSWGLYISFFAIFLRMFLSVAAETSIAIPFKLKPLWIVPVVNAVTQLLLIVFMLASGLTYTTSLIAGEVVVYLAEMLVFLRLYKNIPKRTVIVYTLVANTVTLLMGLVFNTFLLLM